MKYIIFFSCLLMLAGTTTTNASDQLTQPTGMTEAVKASSDSDHYLILASFRDADLVDLFINRMSPQVDKPIRVAKLQFEEITVYRAMIGPFDKKLTRIQNQYASLGLRGIWWISVTGGEPMHFEPDTMIAKAVEAPAIPEEPAAPMESAGAAEPTVAVAPAVVEEPVGASKDRRMQMSVEDLVEFCAMKANAMERQELCSDKQINVKLGSYVDVSTMGDRDYFSYCSKATGKERTLYCTDRIADAKANRMN